MLVAVLAGGAPLAAGDDMPSGARLSRPVERMAVAQAIRGAALKLAAAECQAVLDEFTDTHGRPLRAVLEGQGLDAGAFLDRVFFYDAAPEACEGLTLAGTHLVGSRVIRVCGRRFAREWASSSSHAEAVIIHEMLHALGLGENPPSSGYITARVMARCGR
jgi:hypothetical protein